MGGRRQAVGSPAARGGGGGGGAGGETKNETKRQELKKQGLDSTELNAKEKS